jgi:hypothetical protein
MKQYKLFVQIFNGNITSSTSKSALKMWQLETAYKISIDCTKKGGGTVGSYLGSNIRKCPRPLQQVKDWEWSGAPCNCGTNSIFALREASPLTGGWEVAKYPDLHFH